MGFSPPPVPITPLTWERDVWGNRLTLGCEKRGQITQEREAGNGPEIGFSPMAWRGRRRAWRGWGVGGVCSLRVVPCFLIPRSYESLRDHIMLVAGWEELLGRWAPTTQCPFLCPQEAAPGPSLPPRLLFLLLKPHPGSEMPEGRLSFPGLEAKFAGLAGRSRRGRSALLAHKGLESHSLSCQGQPPTIPHLGMAAPPSPKLTHTWVDPSPSPRSFLGCHSLTAHTLSRGFPY